MLGIRFEKQKNISPQNLKDKRIFDEKKPIIYIKTNEIDYNPMKNQEKQIKYQKYIEISRYLLILSLNQEI